ncbi:MAG: AI-2E family transporter [Chloroflexi bacterium]|nr:AI-2E family transporter [Chloroflexota bacterium]MCC6893665.1 AI-2E family transporter [Anaerolineae bacterium]
MAKDVFRGTLVVLLTLVGAYVVFMSLRILVVVLVAIIIASAVRPLVLRLMRWRFSEGLAIITVYVSILLTIFALFALVIPPIANSLMTNLQSEDRLANRIISFQNWLSDNVQRVTGDPLQLADPAAIRKGVSDFIDSVQPAIPSLVGGAGSTFGEVVLVFVMGVYWLTSYEHAISFLVQLFTLRSREKVQAIIYEIEGMMGSYVRGLAFVALFVGFANFLVLTVLRVPNAATLGFLIGATTILPIVGGFLGGGLATILAILTGTPLHGVAVLGTFVAVQQIETHYLTPRAMSRSVGLDPLLTIVAVLIGFTLGGVVGAIIATPVMGTIAVLLREIVIVPRKESVSTYTMENGLILLNAEPKVEVQITATPADAAVIKTPSAPVPPVPSKPEIILPGKS